MINWDLFIIWRQIFFLLFSLVDLKSLNALKEKLYPKTPKHRPNTRCIIVGTKLDLRSDAGTLDKLKSLGQQPIPADQVNRFFVYKLHQKDCFFF